jgi:hypothetical protein
MAKQQEQPTDQELREGMNEIVTGRRLFSTKKFGKVSVRFPSTEEQRLADWEYSLAMTRGLRDGLMTNAKLESVLEESGIWGQKEKDKLMKIDEDINVELVYLSKLKTEKTQEPVQIKINGLKQERMTLLTERQKFMNISVEAKSEETRISYLTYSCTENAETQERIWATYKDFMAEKNSEDMGIIVMQFLTFINGLSPNLFELLHEEAQTPEESGEQGGE